MCSKAHKVVNRTITSSEGQTDEGREEEKKSEKRLLSSRSHMTIIYNGQTYVSNKIFDAEHIKF